MPELTVGNSLHQSALDHPSLDAVVTEDNRTRFAELDKQADAFANGLIELGVRSGDHVGLWLPTSHEWIVVFCACARIGAVVVPINTHYRKDELAYILSKGDIKVVVAQRTMWSADAYQLICEIAPELPRQRAELLMLEALPRLRSFVLLGAAAPAGALAYDNVIARPVDRDRLAKFAGLVREESRLLICFTSGSTGRPKGVVHTHRTLRHCRRIADVLHMSTGHRHLANWPFHHVAGLFIVLLPALDRAGTMILMPQWDGGKALDLIAKERVTVFGGISTHFIDMVDGMTAKRRDLSSLQAAYVGGATIAKETFEKIVGTLGLPRLLSTYGMTENTVSTTFNSWDDPGEICRQNKARVITEGPVKVVDPGTLKEALTGEAGEIWCSGPTVMEGYYGDVEATKAAITDDGWLRTGDLGRFDEDGYLSIVGRIKEIIKTGGVNVSPAEIENFVMTNPAVKLCIVVGVPDPRLHEVVFAYVQLNEGARADEREIIEFCRPLMASFKVPRYVRFVEEIPRLSTGKVQRKLLADKACDEIGRIVGQQAKV